MIRERSFNSYFSYFLTVASVLTTVLMVLIALLVLAQPAQAQTYTVVHSFGGVLDGRTPSGGVVLDAAGNLYGTTAGGCGLGGKLCLGTVYKVDPTGKETVLHTFGGGPDGAYPFLADLIRDAAGNLYGTTPHGGSSPICDRGCGVVFKLDPSNHETVLHAFNVANGYFPYAGLIRDASGNLYGTTLAGGTYDMGVVFKLDPAGNKTVLYTFTGGADGWGPSAAVIRDAAGNLYGTARYGGAGGNGLVFKVDPAGNKTALYAFTGGADGALPNAGLVRDAAGNLYGTTIYGGPCCGYGYGVVFKLDPAGNETVLHAFNGNDGSYPWGGVIRDTAGNLYGTASYGGPGGYGVVFKLDPSGNLTVLHAFTGPDGNQPISTLIQDAAGNLYGTTNSGGTYNQGVVFKITFP